MFILKTASQHKDNNLHNAATSVSISGLKTKYCYLEKQKTRTTVVIYNKLCCRLHKTSSSKMDT